MRILTFPDGYGDRAESLPLLLPPVSLPPYFSHPFPPVRYIMRERETDDVYISVCMCLRRTSMGGIWGFSQRESVNLCVLLFLCRLFILVWSLPLNPVWPLLSFTSWTHTRETKHLITAGGMRMSMVVFRAKRDRKCTCCCHLWDRDSYEYLCLSEKIKYVWVHVFHRQCMFWIWCVFVQAQYNYPCSMYADH